MIMVIKVLKNYPHSSKNLNKIKKEGMYILYKYNLIIDKNNLMEGLEEKLNQKERIRKIMKKNVQKKVGKKEIKLKMTEKK
jgi:elongation factor P--beta-lysine ligase